ncbi:MAG: hypothetical protein RR827_01590 [Oscillospiraceae bacterium]
MPLFFTLGFILPPTVALSIYTKKRPLETVPLFFFATILYGYIFSLFNLLKLSVLAAVIICIASVGYIVVTLFKKKQIQIAPIVFDIGVIVALGMFLWWLCRGRYYEIWDEISHWGKALKGMCQNDMLYCLANPAHSFNEYSPSVSIFQYIAMECMPFGFREDISMFVQSIMYACLLTWPITRFKKGNIAFKIMAIPVLLLLPVTLFLKFYTYILADSGMGVIFGFLLLYYFLAQEDFTKYATLALGCFVLTLTKTAAVGFSIIVILVILVSEIAAKKNLKKAALLPIIITGATVLARFSWSTFLNVYGVNRRWTASDLNFGSIIALFNGTAPAYRLETVKLFFTNIFTDRVYGFIIKFSYMEWFILLIILAAAAIFMMKKEKRKTFTVAVGTFLLAIFLYTLSVLVSYLFYFSQGEALALASISRYLNPVLVAALVVLIGVLLCEISYKKWTAQLVGWAAALALVINLGSPSILPFFKTCATAPTQAAVTANIRRRFTDITRQLLPLAQDGLVNVYIVSQRDTGLAHLTFTYEMDPVTFPLHEASIGKRYEDWDIWTKFYTAETFEKELYDNFDYLCLFDIDEEFLAQFSGLFNEDSDIQNGNILKVEKLEGGKINLVRIN